MPRRTELDALRGLLLLAMAITHLPTRLSAYSDQMLGFVSTAEGFVFLSAFIAGRAYSALMLERGAPAVRQRLWRRALTLYGYHLGLLLFAFVVAAGFAMTSGRPGLRNLLSFYFQSPGWAAVSGPLLLYQPPLLDILPMYIAFLAVTPWVLQAALAGGWNRLLCLSALLWLFAQAGGQSLVHAALGHLTGWPLPLDARGAFDWFAWQVLWICGLRLGAAGPRQPITQPAALQAPYLVAMAVLASIAFFVWRHRIAGVWVDLGVAFSLLDKWHLGALRLLNFAALAVVARYAVLPALAALPTGAFTLLGRGSLQAFTAHILVCLLSLGFVIDDATPLSAAQQVFVLLLALGAMLCAAWMSSATPSATAPQEPRCAELARR